MDKIIIKNLKIFGYHGVNKEEKLTGQNFLIDINAYTKKLNSLLNDDLNETVNYSKIIKKLIEIFNENSYDLIETVAEMLAKNLIVSFEKIIKIDIVVKKPEAPIKAHFKYVAVEISRKREDYIG